MQYVWQVPVSVSLAWPGYRPIAARHPVPAAAAACQPVPALRKFEHETCQLRKRPPWCWQILQYWIKILLHTTLCL
jgi:hypothetical protein